MTTRRKVTVRAGAVSVFAALLFGCALEARAQSRAPADIAVIPMPARIEPASGGFIVTGRTRIVASDNPEAARIASYFADLLWRTCQMKLEVAKDRAVVPAIGAITLVLDGAGASSNGSKEGYTLDVRPNSIVVEARDPRGLFYGVVTLWQWLTANPQVGGALHAEAVHIEDQPQFPWRGFMLDSARHFMPPEFIRKLLDAMALHKLNTFHWHLSDDQGWRMQIRKYPKLTEVGSQGVSPGYYTQEEVREIVRYAADRFITIVPEIEMPGHAQAAIAAYPELGTEGVAPAVSHDWGVHDYLYNVDESTFRFLEDVLTEVIALFPGEYVHVGGDEAVKTRWHASPRVQQRMRELGASNEVALQGYFVHRMEGFLRAHGRKLIGWDEILEGDVPPQATVMSWRGGTGAMEAAARGHDVVLATAPNLYLDYLQSDLPDEPPGRPQYQTLAELYAFNPGGDRVIGAQLNAWTEHMRTPERVEHNAFPRVAALSELLWSAPERRNWERFVSRLPAQFDRYRHLGIQFADSAFAVRMSQTAGGGKDELRVALANQIGRGEIHYSLDGADPTLHSPRYLSPFQISMPATVRAVTFLDGRRMSDARTKTFSRQSLLHRSDDELRSCSGKLPLRLEDDAPAAGERATFNIDILDPCWIYPQADLARVRGITAAVGQLPFNFQVGDDARTIPLHPPQTQEGELEVRIDGCEGERIAVLPLAPAASNPAVTELPRAPMAARVGLHDLCLYFTRRSLEPMWALEWVQLTE